MKKARRRMEKKLIFIFGMIFFVSLVMPLNLYAADTDENRKLKHEIEKFQEQLDELEERLDQTELHSATDRVSLGLELRTRVDSIRYSDISAAPSWLMAGFFTPVGTNPNTGAAWTAAEMNAITPGDVLSMMSSMPPGTTLQDMLATNGFNGATKNYIQSMMAALAAAGAVPDAETYNAKNDMIYTNKFRLNMNAKVNQNLSFSGRLAMYKVFGDSSEVKMMNGSLGDINLDGNTSSVPHGDTVHVERAYFNYTKDVGDVPINFSLGRRPATEGPPREYGNYSLEGGSPVATIINWQFDGASLSFGLEDVTGIPGAAFKLCYGVGFESGYGNSYSLSGSSIVDDATFGGFIATLYDNDETSVVLNYAHAWDITDGFSGTVVMPFIPYKDGEGVYTFTPNTGGYISRMEASTNIGDFDIASLVLRTNFSEYFSDIDLFVAPSWSRTHPSEISRNPYYEMMGQGLVSTADSEGKLESHDGYSIYAGVLFPMPFDARLGFEYNWGSEYWFNMTGAEDSLIASKLAARGQVYEAYYIQPVYRDNFFVKLGSQYYDYEYTGSGNPLGAPVKIDDLTAFDAFFPVVDTAWNTYLSATVRF
ncbi:MAG: DUF3373 family protein [Desulfobacterales bacterium]